MGNLLNFEFKVNPSICEFEGDETQLYEAFKLPESNKYVVCWETKNGKSQVLYEEKDVKKAIAEKDWIIQG